MLPTVSDYTTDTVMHWLRDRENMKRPPYATAKFLAFCVELHLQGQPFPPRKEAAAHLGVSVSLIDTALSHRISTEYITVELKYIDGNVKQRPSVKRQHIIIPSAELIKIVQAAPLRTITKLMEDIDDEIQKLREYAT